MKRITVQLPDDLHELLKRNAKMGNRKVADYARMAIQRAVAHMYFTEEMINKLNTSGGAVTQASGGPSKPARS